MSTKARVLSPMDLLLVLAVVVWGVNYSVLKRAFLEIPPTVFATLRLAIASTVFLLAIYIARRRAAASAGSPGMSGGLGAVFFTPSPLTTRDRWDLVWLGVVGHCLYQFCFIGGLARTAASNAALIFGTTPVLVAIISSVLGHERIGRLHWIGAALSAAGVYFVVGRNASVGVGTLRGDLLIGAGGLCWAIYTIGGTRLMARHSPLFVTGVSMAIGTVPYTLLSIPQFFTVEWSHLSAAVWWALMFAALGAFCFSYVVWYAAVQRLGPAHTAIYSNAIPLVAMLGAAVWLGEPITVFKLVGATAVIGGVVLTKAQTSSKLEAKS